MRKRWPADERNHSRDPYEVLGLSQTPASRRSRRHFASSRRELHPDVNAHDPAGRGEVRRPPRQTRSSPTPSAAPPTTAMDTRACARGGYAPNFESFGSIGDLFNAFFGGGGSSAGPALGGDIAVGRGDDAAGSVGRRQLDVSYEAIDRCEHCHGNGAEPGTPIESCSRCEGAGQVQSVVRTPFGQMMRTSLCDVCHGDGRVPPSLRDLPRSRQLASSVASRSRSRRGSPTVSGSA